MTEDERREYMRKYLREYRREGFGAIIDARYRLKHLEEIRAKDRERKRKK
jgi:hypothetical protein